MNPIERCIEKHKHTISHSKDEARELLRNAEFRATDHPEHWTNLGYAQILIDGEWLDVVRTDIVDDVATWPDLREIEFNDLREHFINKLCRHGARLIKGEYFALIDRTSDG